MHEIRQHRRCQPAEAGAVRRRSHAQVQALTEGERDLIANLANTASLLYHSMPDLNWVGFYLLKDGELVVGPFQGKPACVRIALGKGVCGTAAARRATADRRERARVRRAHRVRLGVELGDRGADRCAATSCIGVLDLDSPKFSRFDARGSGAAWSKWSRRLLESVGCRASRSDVRVISPCRATGTPRSAYRRG